MHQKPYTWLIKTEKTTTQAYFSATLGPPSGCNNMNTIREDIPLDLNPILTHLIFCLRCFAMYAKHSKTPSQCIHLAFHNASYCDPHPSSALTICGAFLFHPPPKSLTPIHRFAVQSLPAWVARLLCCPHIEEVLDTTALKSCEPYSANVVSGIHESCIWKSFLGKDGQQFMSKSNHLSFGFFIDGINPHGNKQAGKKVSITFMVLVCLSLPISLHYKPQNIFIVRIAPGPKEPSLVQTNWILRPMIEDPHVPALRRTLGFAVCTACLIHINQISNLDFNSWPKRNADNHRARAEKSRNAAAMKEKTKILLEYGVRYLAFLKLPAYRNIIENHVVDSMHNLLLGLLGIFGEREPALGTTCKELEDLLANLANAPLSQY
ncbi:hypothetical protein MJO29_015068 [Puccinia striiformis f. sp. tritici]|nr:hypothetical protein MJO29_015068 [Puccinia striiformis f. sp. tritici]